MSTQKQITSLRVQAYRFHYNSLLFEGVDRIKAHKVACAENPMNWFAGAFESGVSGFGSDPAPYQPWWSDFHHRYLHMVAIMYLTNSAVASDDKEKFDQMEPLYGHTYGTIIEFLRDIVAVTHPTVAKRLFGMAGCQIELLS